MKRMFPRVLLFVILAGISGCMFDSDDKDDGKKGSVSGKVTMIATGEALPGIKVYLVDKNADINTTDLSGNFAAFVDSAVTNAKGEYTISDVIPSAYAVVPVNGDTTKVFRFTYAAGSDSSGFTMHGDVRTVNFIAEKLNYPGAETGYDGVITIRIFAPRKDPIKFIQVFRKNWIVFVPIWSFEGYSGYSESEGCYISTYIYGFSWGMQTVENVWKYAVLYQSGPGTILKKEFFIGFSLYDVPAVSSWDYDFDTNTLTRRFSKIMR